MGKTSTSDLVPGVNVGGPIVPEPIGIMGTTTVGGSVKLVGRGLRTGLFRDPETERLAVPESIHYEQARGWQVENLESENDGFDLISRKPHPDGSETVIEVQHFLIEPQAVADAASTLTEPGS